MTEDSRSAMKDVGMCVRVVEDCCVLKHIFQRVERLSAYQREWWEADMREREEALAKAEAICQAQEEQVLQGMLGISFSSFELLKFPFPELSANAHPEEDGDYEPEDVMDVDKGASPRKGKGSELEEREGPT